MYDKLIFELSNSIENHISLPENNYGIDEDNLINKKFLRDSMPDLPTVSEIDVLRHFVNLSIKNHHILKGFYPLGSCTMKYNPVINEDIASFEGFTELHPYQDEEDVQGILKIIYELQEQLADISGFSTVSLMPVAGAHSEFAGMMLIRAYHKSKNLSNKKYILIPDSAHGTNPASCILSGFQTINVKSDENGEIDIDDLKSKVNEETAGIMITNPNTLGIFESKIKEIADIIHSVDALIYMDGANFNALMGIVKPGEIGCDIMHFNLHKTFATPHGGGGPGNGGVAVNDKLAKFLPSFFVEKNNDNYSFGHNEQTIGALHMFFGNVNIMIRAWAYIKVMGGNGLAEVTENAIINANYLRSKLEKIYNIQYDTPTLHEFVINGSNMKKEFKVKTLDIAKRLLDYGIHAPTVYFPLIVNEALMIEPTETESINSLDLFIDIMKKIFEEAQNNPELLLNAPTNTPVSRLNDIKALKEFNTNYYKANQCLKV